MAQEIEQKVYAAAGYERRSGHPRSRADGEAPAPIASDTRGSGSRRLTRASGAPPRACGLLAPTRCIPRARSASSQEKNVSWRTTCPACT